MITLAMMTIASLVSFLTVPSYALGEVDTIILNEDNEQVKELKVSNYENTEKLLTAIASALDNSNENNEEEDKDSNSNGGESSSTSSSGGGSSSNNGDFEQVMESASDAYQDTIKEFETEEISNNNEQPNVIQPTIVPPISNPPISAAAAAASNSAAAAAATNLIPFPPTPLVEESIIEDMEIIPEEQPEESDGQNEGDSQKE